MTEADQGQDAGERRVAFDMLKSNFFRVIHVEGAFGGVSPHGQLRVVLFNERYAIPKHTEHVLEPDGTLGGELRAARDGRNAIVRELECEIVMTLESAKLIHTWLSGKIKDLEKIRDMIAVPAVAQGAASPAAEEIVAAEPSKPKEG